jgi:hypothetical protein
MTLRVGIGSKEILLQGFMNTTTVVIMKYRPIDRNNFIGDVFYRNQQLAWQKHGLFSGFLDDIENEFFKLYMEQLMTNKFGKRRNNGAIS